LTDEKDRSGRGAPPDPVVSPGLEAARREFAEEAWREAEEKYRELVENSEDLISTHDLDGVLLFANPALVQLFGYPLERLLGRRLDEWLTEESRSEFRRMLASVTQEGRADGFLRVRCRSGQERVIQFGATLARESGREVVRGIGHDVQRRWAEHALRLSVGRLEALLHNIPDLAWLKDERGAYSAVNEALARFLGRSRRSFVGHTDREFFPEEMATRFEESDRQAVERGASVQILQEVKGESGETRYFETTKTPIRDERGLPSGTVGIARDVTERRRLEEQLLQSRKMEAIGRLAGGVAHDFNNLLTTILGYGGMLLDQLGPDDPLRPDVEEIQRAGERAASLTQQLLAFSRKQVFEPSVLDLNAVVSEATRMLRRLIREDVQLLTSLEPDLGAVRADRSQLEQVLINLAVNARDAMPRGGELRIQTRNVERPAGAVPSGAAVLLSVADTGAGIDAETRRRLFEPFFTTKERGKGTGLGLATVYGIVAQSGGEIWVESEPGRGTTFHVALPRVTEPVSPAGPRARPESPLGGSETLLLVEDEEAVRRLVSRRLESLGYAVLSAGNAEEAVGLWQAHRDRVRLLVTDVIMPGRSGPQLAVQLVASAPELKVIYVSGYTDSSIVEGGVLAAGTEFLQKPFEADALARRIREVLDGPAPNSPKTA
jgi:PAS domain S-box-containing protein